MLWRVRTTLADRPGTLATLARHCGERAVNILGLQIFPGLDGVTDELVLRSPTDWGLSDVAELVESAGGTEVSIVACTEHALVDGPTRYLHAVRRVVHGGEDVGEALAGLLDAEAGPGVAAAGGRLRSVQDHLEVEVGGRRVEVRRVTPFTGTEHARATAFAETVAHLTDRGPELPEPVLPMPATASGEVLVRRATYADTAGLMAMHGRCSHDTVYRHFGAPLARIDLRLARRVLVGEGTALVAVADGMVVGLATLSRVVDGRCEISVLVEDRWQRRGIGTRLLGAVTRQAAQEGAHDVVMRGPADSPAAIAMVFGSGLRARVRLTGDELVVTISTRGLTGGRGRADGRTTPVGQGGTVTPLRPAPA